MKMRDIFFAIGSLEVGGAEKQLLELISQIQGNYYRCHVFTLQSGGSLREQLRSLGVAVHSGGLHKQDLSTRPWKVIAAQWRLIKTIHQTGPDIIHSFLPLVTFMGAVAGKLCKVPLVITSRRALGNHQKRVKILRPMDLMANRWSHRVTVNSMAVWNDVLRRDKIDPRKLMLIYNAVDVTAYDSARKIREQVRQTLNLKPAEKAVIAIANFIPYKGHSDLFQAAALVLREMPDMRLLLVGEDRGIRRSLEKQVAELGIGPSVRFLGSRNDVPELLAASDLSVISSHEEGFSNVILESMASGLPVVATDVGGNREAVVDGETGWLTAPENPEALAHKIVDLLTDPERARQWGEKGRERVKNKFTMEEMARGHVKLYETAFAAVGRHSKTFN